MGWKDWGTWNDWSFNNGVDIIVGGFATIVYILIAIPIGIVVICIGVCICCFMIGNKTSSTPPPAAGVQMQQMGMMQPGMQQPGMMQPGMMQPGMEQQGMPQS